MNLILQSKLFCLWVAVLLCVGSVRLHAQNREGIGTAIQYHRLRYQSFKWQAFRTPAFHLYYPRGYDSLASFIAKELPAATALLSRRMGFPPAKEPQIILYPSSRHLYQSNAGSTEPQELTLPTFIRKGNRLLLSYDGSYEHLKAALYTALTRSAWEAQFPTGSLGQQAKGNNNTDVPVWYREGTIAFFATGWMPEDEDAFREALGTDTAISWTALIQKNPGLAGRALNYYLSQTYFPEAPQGLLFQVRAKKSLRRGMRLLAKRPLDTVLAQCTAFYRQRFTEAPSSDSADSTMPTMAFSLKKPAGVIRHWLVEPSGQTLLLVAEKEDRRKVYAYSLSTRKLARLFTYRLPPWLTSYDADPYPLLAYEGEKPWALVPHKGYLEIRHYGPAGKIISRFPLRGVDGVERLIPLGGQRFLLSAHRLGRSDLIIFDGARGRYTALTSDPEDDHSPVPQGTDPTSAVFASARPDKGSADTNRLRAGLYRLAGKEVVPVITDTLVYAQWEPLAWLDGGKLLASTTRSGTQRLALIEPKNPFSEPVFLPGETRVQYLTQTGTVAHLEEQGDSVIVYTQPLGQWLEKSATHPADTATPWLRDYCRSEALRAKEDSILRVARDTTQSFLSGVLSTGTDRASAQKRKDSLAELSVFRSAKARPYVLQLYSAYFTARLSADYFINRYQPYRAYLGQFKFPEAGGLARGGYSDLFENHHFTIAYRLPSGTEGSDFFVNYRNAARRTEWGLTYFRKVESLRPDPARQWVDAEGRPYPIAAKVKTHYYELSLRRSLSYSAAVGYEAAIRKDRTIFLATDRYSLAFPSLESLWLLNTLSASLDRRRPVGLPGLYKGYTGKAFLDVFKAFAGGEETALALRTTAEHHQPFYKGITLVGRIQAGYSGGDGRVLYNTGGVDGALNPKVDSTVEFGQDAPYVFQTLATPLRGYAQNRLYGDRYALLNAELWVPLFGELIPLETPLPAINGLQVGLFTDWATAKEGWRRGSRASSLWSYGWSARITLAGYPVRADMGWPGAFGKKPLWYLSLTVQ